MQSDDTRCISKCADKTLPCQLGNKIHFTMCWTKPSHDSEVTKCISTFDQKILQMRARTKMHLNMCWPNTSYSFEHTKSFSTCVDLTYPMPPKVQNAYKIDLTNLCQWEHKVHPNIKSSNASDVYQKIKLEMHKLNLITWWPNTSQTTQHVLTNTSHASEDTKCIPTCVDQTHPMSARTQSVTQLVLFI